MWVQSLGPEDSPGEGNCNPFQYCCLENSMNGGTWRSMGSQRVSDTIEPQVCVCVRVRARTHTHTHIHINTVKYKSENKK